MVDSSPFALILSEAKDPDIRLYIPFARSGEAIQSVVDLCDLRTVKTMGELERRLGKDFTTRNWNTVVKMMKTIISNRQSNRFFASYLPRCLQHPKQKK